MSFPTIVVLLFVAVVFGVLFIKKEWQKALWVYLAIYILAVAGLLFVDTYTDISTGNFNWVALPLPLALLLPPYIVALGLLGKKIPVIILVLCLIIVAIPLAGIFKFNPLNIATIAKAFIFIPLIISLLYFGQRRLVTMKEQS